MSAKPIKNRLYAQVSGDIAARIGQGDYAIGSRLPAERDLAVTYKVSRPTIREAMIALEVDGLVDVRKGSGVYVVARGPKDGQARETDIGPFELLEARRAIEGEACAIAAGQITDAELDALSDLVTEMQSENLHGDIARSEEADRRFHLLIAEATRNSALVATVEMLWDVRARSPQTQMLARKALGAGVKPRVDEHRLILEALATRDPASARVAMRAHISRVLEALLELTEVEELARARQRVAAHRQRYANAD
jgi:DNA-binding FadR family transcriptional regulator